MRYQRISGKSFHPNAVPMPLGTVIKHFTITGYVRSFSGGCSKIGYLCRCRCGKKCIKGREALKEQLSCGCVKRPQKKRGHSWNYKPHLHDANGKRTGTYGTWAAMIQRCKNKKLPQWKNYGGRGIKVCRRWLKFDNFLADMGEKPEGLSIDRIDNDGNYTLKNCRWATDQEQAENTTVVRKFTCNGKTLTMQGWAKFLGINSATMSWRVSRHGYEGAIKMGGPTGFRDIATVNRTGLRGVGRRGEKFFAQIQHQGKVLYLGRFDTDQEAHQAYLSARERFSAVAP